MTTIKVNLNSGIKYTGDIFYMYIKDNKLVYFDLAYNGVKTISMDLIDSFYVIGDIDE